MLDRITCSVWILKAFPHCLLASSVAVKKAGIILVPSPSWLPVYPSQETYRNFSLCALKLHSMSLGWVNFFVFVFQLFAGSFRFRDACPSVLGRFLSIIFLRLSSTLSPIPITDVTYLPDKPIINWKYCKSKMHLIHWTYWTS